MGAQISKTNKKKFHDNSNDNSPKTSTLSENSSTNSVEKPKKSRLKFWSKSKSSTEKSNKIIGEFISAESDDEIDRVQLQHHMFRVTWDGNYKSPIEESLKSGCDVLDIGCGPGTWVAEMSIDYPNSTIIGIDKIHLFPDQKPINAQFIKADLLDKLPFKNNHFDFVHYRSFGLWLSEADWKRGLEEALRVVKPGGYLEILEVEAIPRNTGPVTIEIMAALRSLMESSNKNPYMVPVLGDILASTNAFSHIYCDVRKVPIGQHMGNLGKLSEYNVIRMCRITKSKLVLFLNANESLYEDQYINPLINEINTYKTFFYQYRFYARKKENEDQELILYDAKLKRIKENQ